MQPPYSQPLRMRSHKQLHIAPPTWVCSRRSQELTLLQEYYNNMGEVAPAGWQ